MNASFKTALFLLLASAALASHEDTLKKLKGQRHPFLAPLSDPALTPTQANLQIGNHFNSLLAVSEGTADDNQWLNLLTRKQGYAFKETDKGLDVKTVEDRLTAIVNSLFQSIESAEVDQVKAVFQDQKSHLLNEAERLVKLELVTQLFTLLDKSDDKITLHRDIIVHVQNHINSVVLQLEERKELSLEEERKTLNEALTGINDRLEGGYFKSLVSLMDLLKNSAFFIKQEITVMHSLAQFKNLDDSDEFLVKFDFVFDLYAQTSVNTNKKDNISKLFGEFRKTFTDASKAGSSIGSVQFKKLTPRIVGTAIRIIGTYESPQQAYDNAKEYLRFISARNVEKSNTVTFLNEYLEAGNKPNFVITDDRTFAIESLKAVDIIKKIPYNKVDAGWWVHVLDHFDHILVVVSAERTNLVENTKDVACNRIATFKTKSGYYLGLYNLLMAAVVDVGRDMSDPSTWASSFLEYVQEKFAEAKEGKNPDQAEAEYLKKYYPMIVFHILAFRPKEETETGRIHFQDFISNGLDVLHKQMIAEFSDPKDPFQSLLLIAFVNQLNAKNPITPGKVYSTSEITNLAYMATLSGQNVPLNFFKSLNTNQNTKTEVKQFVGVADTRKEVNFNIADSKVRDVVRKDKTPAKSPIIENPSPKKEEPVIEEAEKHKEESPKKEEKKLEEEIKTPVKTEETKETDPIVPDDKKKEEVHIPLKDIEEGVHDDLHSPTHIGEDIKSPKDEKTTVKEDPKPFIPEDPHKSHDGSPKKIDDGVTPINKINLDHFPDEAKDKNDTPSLLTGKSIQMTPTHIDVPSLTLEERLNLIEVLKGQFDDPDLIERLKHSDDLAELIGTMTMKIEVDPITGDETHYYFVQLVETETACHSEITELTE